MSGHDEMPRNETKGFGDYSDPSDEVGDQAAHSYESSSAVALSVASVSSPSSSAAPSTSSSHHDSAEANGSSSSSSAPSSMPSSSSSYGGGGGGGGGSRLPNLAHKVYVGNLPPSATERDIEDMFRNAPQPCAQPARIDLKPQGYAFVHFERDDGLNEALRILNGSDFMGVKLRIEWSKPQTTRCFICKRDGHWARDCPDNRESNRHGGGGRGGDDRYGSRSGGRDYERARSPVRGYGGGGRDHRGDRSPPRRGYSPPPQRGGGDSGYMDRYSDRSGPRGGYTSQGGSAYYQQSPAVPASYQQYAPPVAYAPAPVPSHAYDSHYSNQYPPPSQYQQPPRY